MFFIFPDKPVSLRSTSTSSKSELKILLIMFFLLLLMLGESPSAQTLGRYTYCLGFVLILEFDGEAYFKVQKLKEPGIS